MKDRNPLSKTAGPRSRFRKNVAASIIVVLGLMMVFGLATTFRASAQESTAVKEISPEQAKISQWGLIAAAVAFGSTSGTTLKTVSRKPTQLCGSRNLKH